MAGRIWDDVVPERDRVVFAEAGYGAIGGFGQRPALLVVDVTYDFCGDRADERLRRQAEGDEREARGLQEEAAGGHATSSETPESPVPVRPSAPFFFAILLAQHEL